MLNHRVPSSPTDPSPKRQRGGLAAGGTPTDDPAGGCPCPRTPVARAAHSEKWCTIVHGRLVLCQPYSDGWHGLPDGWHGLSAGWHGLSAQPVGRGAYERPPPGCARPCHPAHQSRRNKTLGIVGKLAIRRCFRRSTAATGGGRYRKWVSRQSLAAPNPPLTMGGTRAGFGHCAREDSNLQPTGSKPATLSIELRARFPRTLRPPGQRAARQIR